MRRDRKERLKSFFEQESFPGVVSVYLFGSHAEVRAHRESDVDVGVLLDRDLLKDASERFESRVRLGSRLCSVLGENEIDLVVLNDAPPLLGRKIVSAGIRVFCSRPDKDLAFVRDIQSRAADLEPFLRKMRKLKLEALVR